MSEADSPTLNNPLYPPLPPTGGGRVCWSRLYGSSYALLIAAAAARHPGLVLAITPDSQLFIGDARKAFKVSHLYRMQGKEQIEMERGVPGDGSKLPVPARVESEVE